MSKKKMPKRRRIAGIIFDLDNVLYDETDYILGAYRAVALYLSNACSINKNYVYRRLKNDFKEKTSLYPRLFNNLLNKLELDDALLPKILEIYSCVRPKIKLYRGAKPLLSDLGRGYRLGLLTNGRVKIQKNKVKLLKIEKLFDEILYARELGDNCEKPNAIAYRVLLDRLGIPPKNAIYIGDNPYIDFIGAKKLGILTVRVLAGEFKDVKADAEHDADLTINDLKELKDLLEV